MEGIRNPGNYVQYPMIIEKRREYCSRARGYLHVEVANIVIATPVTLGIPVVESEAFRSAVESN